MAYLERTTSFTWKKTAGSYVVIDTWLVDVVFDAETSDLTAAEKTSKKVYSENCRACIKACPTGALDGPFSMGRGKCVAHFSFKGWAGEMELY